MQLRNVLQDTDNADGDGDSTTGIGLSDVTVVNAPDAEGDGPDILVTDVNVFGAPACSFTARALLEKDATELCKFSASVAAQKGELAIGEKFSVAYLGNEALTIPLFAGSGPFSLRLGSLVQDWDNADGDQNLATGVTAADIKLVDGPDSGLIVSGFDPASNVVTISSRSGEELVAGEPFTVQYMNREDLSVPATSVVTQQRLYLEAMEQILPNINKIIVSPEAQSVLVLGGQGGLVPVPVGPSPGPSP